jgi:hypothetical protein
MKMNNFFREKKPLPHEEKDGNELSVKGKSILDQIEKIVEISTKHGIEKSLFMGKKYLNYVTQKLGINPIQAVMFSHFMERSERSDIRISEIAEAIKCSTVRILKYMNECEELEKKKLIRCSRSSGCITYRVSRCVCDSLRKYNEFKPEKIDNLSITKFFVILERIFEEKKNDELSYDVMKIEIMDLINQNMQLLFCKKIMSYKLDDDDLMLLIRFCYLFGMNNDDYIIMSDIEFLYDEDFIAGDVKWDLTHGCHTLITKELIENINNNKGFLDSDSWKLSDIAKKELLSELKGKINYQKDLILFDKIKDKKMFYNAKETEAILKLNSLLKEDNYRKIQDRLDGKGMRKGFACLFSGGPGTGKTETALQIALATKRNIMMVDIADTKSKWYGESEKKIKEVFDTYRTVVEKSEIAPILLFNEADAVIGKRKVGLDNQSIEQTENTIQNIILQEMENLSGILIATTNLTQNMDSAFERRFLYKVIFDKPSHESRKGIWNSMLPDLSDDNAEELSKKYELSGGQIENITRKVEVDAIINGSELCMDTLVKYCKEEIHNGLNTGKKIGFGE